MMATSYIIRDKFDKPWFFVLPFVENSLLSIGFLLFLRQRDEKANGLSHWIKIVTPPTRGVRFVFFAFLPHFYITCQNSLHGTSTMDSLEIRGAKKQMRTYVFKLYCSKRNKHIPSKPNLAGSIYNHLAGCV
ncbi:MAG: hypothetical protein LBD04_10725 [Synergistaceae bacterium]|jgi:hypothetical protein|nr:hypothetical protein [Synergistaceae bacterium]